MDEEIPVFTKKMTGEEFNKELLKNGPAPIFNENRKYFDKEDIEKDTIYCVSKYEFYRPFQPVCYTYYRIKVLNNQFFNKIKIKILNKIKQMI